ncbi:hypothetical protein ENBRE01_1893 [Enteropsectra breve]|nr:hypothetical protein ENBRE01_1893 [Enteropsectra breve]
MKKYFLNSSTDLLKRLAFIQKYSSTVQIGHNFLYCPLIQINMEAFCDFSGTMPTAEFAELVKNTDFFYSDGKTVKYEYYRETGKNKLLIQRDISLVNAEYNIELSSAIANIKIPDLNVITKDEIEFTAHPNKIVMRSHGYIKTQCVLPAQGIDMKERIVRRVRPKDLKIIEDLAGEKVLSFFRDFMVCYKFEDAATTAVIIKNLE